MKKVTMKKSEKGSKTVNMTEYFPFVATIRVDGASALKQVENLTDGTALYPKRGKPSTACRLSVVTEEDKAIGEFEWPVDPLGGYGTTQNRVITEWAPFLKIKAARVVPLSARPKSAKYGLVFVLVDFDETAAYHPNVECETVPYDSLPESDRLIYEFMYPRDKAVLEVWEACKAEYL